jgi:hypothetical protein
MVSHKSNFADHMELFGNLVNFQGYPVRSALRAIPSTHANVSEAPAISSGPLRGPTR